MYICNVQNYFLSNHLHLVWISCLWERMQCQTKLFFFKDLIFVQQSFSLYLLFRVNLYKMMPVCCFHLLLSSRTHYQRKYWKKWNRLPNRKIRYAVRLTPPPKKKIKKGNNNKTSSKAKPFNMHIKINVFSPL